MAQSDKLAARAGQPVCDLLVVGGGVSGCWMALKAADAGLDTLLVEQASIGAGASGGYLGALMPHMPERWNDKKEFQFRALVSLEAEIDALENRTGLGCGYGRIGRFIPFNRSSQRESAAARIDEAAANWGGGFEFRILDAPIAPGWPAESAMPAGAAYETLSARLAPRALLAALGAALKAHPRVSMMTARVEPDIDARASSVRLADGTRISFAHLALCNGVDAFAMMDRLLNIPGPGIGSAVKGQAALLDARLAPGLPLIFDEGVYAIVHQDGAVAVGSTSEDVFSEPFATDEKLEAIVARVRDLCPLMAQAPVIGRWAGLRPRAAGRDPMLGPLPGNPRVLALAGGFKITFGIAHRMAEAALAALTGTTTLCVPESFSVEAHLAEAGRRRAVAGH